MSEFKKCECGCGKNVSSSKAMYLPGHDARHVSQVVTAAVEEVKAGENINNRALYADLPTEMMRAKARRYTESRMNRKPPKGKTGSSDKAPAEVVGTVKVGRWEYPARMTKAGKLQRNKNRDGSGSWVDAPANAELIPA